MAITRDTANEPATNPFTSSVATFTTGQATGAFSPQAGTLVVVISACGTVAGAGAGPTLTVVDNHSNTYTQSVIQSAKGQNAVAVNLFYYASAPGSTTVTVTASATSISAGGMIEVHCYLGAASTQAGNTVAVSLATAGALQGAITVATGNTMDGGATNFTDSTALAVIANTTAAGAFNDAVNGDSYGACTSTSTGTTITYGYSTSKVGGFVAVEIQAAAAATGLPEVTMAPRIPT